MTVTLSVETKTPFRVAMPSGEYTEHALAVVDLAIALTKHKMLSEAAGHKNENDLRSTLKHARDRKSYAQSGLEMRYDDDNLTVTITSNEGFVVRTTPRIFVDSDGVFAHFDEQVETITGYPIEELGDDRMWALCGPQQAFWDTMPKMDDADTLWAAVKDYAPTVLTGCPKTDYDLAAARKPIWWKQGFDHNDIITCLSKDKSQFVLLPGDVLIDDFNVNIKRWREAGGIGIWHKSAESTIAQLRKLGIIE